MPEQAVRRCGFVAIVGRPNVGKSTLLNRLLGQKLAITSHKAQTTRHAILGIKTRATGQIIYVDTPGIHQRRDHALNRYLNRAAGAVVRDVDVVVFLVESPRWTAEDDQVLDHLRASGAPVILAINKTDRVADKGSLLPFIAATSARFPFREVVPISARKGTNLDALEAVVLAALPGAADYYAEDQVTDRSERFFAAELIREQLIRRYGNELPYATSVEIEGFQEQGQLYKIDATIWVERPGQKAIVIGKGGQALKETARQARLEMEKFFQTKVFLRLWVRVKKSWSSDEAALARLGYSA